MLLRRLVIASAASLVLFCGSAYAQSELKNDSFVDGQMAAAQGGFVPGEVAAARYQVAGPRQLLSVRTIFANAVPGGTAIDVTLRVWTDDGTSLNPGAELFSGDFTLMPSQTQLQELSVAGSNIMVSGWFRIGIEVHHTGVPSVVNDINGFSNPAASLIKEATFGWLTSQTLGVSGDWILRAVVADPGGSPDAGTTGPDAGTTGPDAGTGGPDAATTGPDAGTGGTCSGNAECPLGQFCDTQLRTCTFECRTADDCGGGTCNSLGQCVAATGDSGGCCSTGSATTGGMLGALGLAGVVGLLVTRRRRRT